MNYEIDSADVEWAETARAALYRVEDLEGEVNNLSDEISSLNLTIEYMAQAITDVERERDSHWNEIEFLNSELETMEAERDSYADVFEATTDDYDILFVRVLHAISDLRTLTEVPLNELESSIDAIIGRLRGEL